VGEYSAWQSVSSLRALLKQFPSLPQISSERGILAGHSMGAHGAMIAAANRPDAIVCLSAAAGWIKKEEYATANAFFQLDVQNSYIDAELVALLTKSLSEFHVDKFSENLNELDVHLRVGSGDSTTHPWFSRRMHRLFLKSGINSTLEEVNGKQHWWWDTDKDNDGGVLNDGVMRAFYHACLQRINIEQQSTRDVGQPSQRIDKANREEDADHFKEEAKQEEKKPSVATTAATTATTAATSATAKKTMKENGDIKKKPKKTTEDGENSLRAAPTSRRCHQGNFTLSLVSVGSQRGLCGVKILQQFQSLGRSSVRFRCSSDASRCDVATSNVRRLLVPYKTILLLHQHHHKFHQIQQQEKLQSLVEARVKLVVNGISEFDLAISNVNVNVKRSYDSEDGNNAENNRDVEICFSSFSADFRVQNASSSTATTNAPAPRICPTSTMDALNEKTPLTTGPIRMVYSRPFYIVYGTPQDQALRIAMRDLAIYIGNSHAAAHGTQVRIVTDLEYMSNNYASHARLFNLLLVGGPTMNKITRRLCRQGGLPPLRAKCPVRFELSTGEAFTSTSDEDNVLTHFGIGPHLYDGPNDAAIFTMPLARRYNEEDQGDSGDDTADVALGVCIHATSAQGYLHMSRLAWPVVPPMVRSPFANYLPDYMVIDERVWALGFGAVRAAGFWNANWQYDASSSFHSDR